MRNSERAFTVAELLAAIGIIGVLLVLLAMGRGRIREVSDNIRCVNNLRTIGRQSLQFFHEQNGDLFPEWNWFRTEKFLDLLEIPEPRSGVRSNRDTVFTCPSFKRKYPALFPSSLNRTYSLNYWAHYYQPQAQQKGEEQVPRLKPGNLRNIRTPSAMWMFMDGAQNGFVFTYYNSGHIPYMGRPHRQYTANAVFFDGHVEPVTHEQLSQTTYSDFWGRLHE